MSAAPEPVAPAAAADPALRITCVAPTSAPGVALSPPQAGVVNVANVLTVARLIMVPIFLLLLLPDRGVHTSWRAAATIVFVAASLTDRVDGELARRRGLVTDFGKIADPIADKALTGAALIALSIIGALAWWVTIVVMAREIGITLLRFWVIRRGVMAASRGGKVKTVLQGFAIGFYLLRLSGPLASARAWLMAIAVIVTLVTGVDYIARAIRLRRATSVPAAAVGSR